MLRAQSTPATTLTPWALRTRCWRIRTGRGEGLVGWGWLGSRRCRRLRLRRWALLDGVLGGFLWVFPSRHSRLQGGYPRWEKTVLLEVLVRLALLLFSGD